MYDYHASCIFDLWLPFYLMHEYLAVLLKEKNRPKDFLEWLLLCVFLCFIYLWEKWYIQNLFWFVKKQQCHIMCSICFQCYSVCEHPNNLNLYCYQWSIAFSKIITTHWKMFYELKQGHNYVPSQLLSWQKCQCLSFWQTTPSILLYIAQGKKSFLNLHIYIYKQGMQLQYECYT